MFLLEDDKFNRCLPRAWLGLAGSRAGRANGPLSWLGQNGQAGAWLWAGKAGWGRLRLGYGQAGARLWAGKAGWGRLGLGYGHARLWAGKAGWGRLWLGYGQVRQAGARLWAGKAGWGRLRLGYGQAWLWAGKAGNAGWGRLWLGPNGQAGAGWGSAIGRLWAGKAGWGRLGQAVARSGRLGQAEARLWAGKAGWGRLWLGPNGQAGAGCGSVEWAGWGSAMGRLGLGPNGQGPLAWLGQNGQAGAGLWAGKAGWGRLGLGYGQARLWAGKAGWGRLRLGYGQAVARSEWAGWGRLGLGYGQAVARSEWAGWGKLGAESWEVFRKEILKHVVDQNSTGVDRVMLISKGTHKGREQAMGWLTAEYQEQMQAQKVIARGDIGRKEAKGNQTAELIGDRREAGHTHTQAEGNRATDGGLYRREEGDWTSELLEDKGMRAKDQDNTHKTMLDKMTIRRENMTGPTIQDRLRAQDTRRKIEIPTGGAFRGGFAGRAGQGSAQLGFAGLGPRQVGQARLGLAGSRAGRANDLALKNKYKERRGRLGWVLDRLGSWGLTKGRLGMAGLEVGQTGQFKGRFDLQKPDKNETSTNSSCPRTPKMEKKPKKEKPPGIEENPPKGKTPPGKETSVKDGFKGKTPLAGKGNTVNFE
ncbi:hypothetical protein PPACK8108_LOCUS8666 [Phakopsora pachyrhizi]|uniref:Uncharacterized protein n=1 Tax=Phakopsora pachyrhizi TaxID=170000 RepID=A0AAV0AV44_PHAPC|nr:hypothetical protein PPACK8108_LOCUS8666 [Phakopsora pachyrhizi]